MLSHTPPTHEFRLTGYHVTGMMLAFFGTVIAVNFGMATLASRSWTGLVVENSYVASQHFNASLTQAEAQRARGWFSKIVFHGGKISVALFEGAGHPMRADEITLTIGRPAFEQADRIVVVRPTGEGVFRTPALLGAGTWSLRVDALVDGLPYRRDARIMVGQNGQGVVR